MADPRFYCRSGPFTLGALAALTKSSISPSAPSHIELRDVAAIDEPQAGTILYADSGKAGESLRGRRDIALILKPGVPLEGLTEAVLFNPHPRRAFAEIAAHFYPHQRQPGFERAGAPCGAKLGEGVRLCAGAVIGAGAEIGAGTIIGPNAVIGPGVLIGRGCRIGANASLAFAILGDRVAIHPGAAIGQDGFGYIGSAAGHFKIPQLGRVIIQDDVEIGACTAIDRGALGDTIIGEGTKIDNLVQIAHNCRIGRHVVLAAQVGMSGSVTIGDFTAMGGQAGIADHVTIGAGARIAAKAGVLGDVPAGATYAGFPARPRIRWLREVAWVARNVKNKRSQEGDPSEAT